MHSLSFFFMVRNVPGQCLCFFLTIRWTYRCHWVPFPRPSHHSSSRLYTLWNPVVRPTRQLLGYLTYAQQHFCSTSITIHNIVQHNDITLVEFIRTLCSGHCGYSVPKMKALAQVLKEPDCAGNKELIHLNDQSIRVVRSNCVVCPCTILWFKYSIL